MPLPLFSWLDLFRVQVNLAALAPRLGGPRLHLSPLGVRHRTTFPPRVLSMADNVFTLPDDMIATFKVATEDAFGNPRPGDVGTPTVTSSDPTVVVATLDDAADTISVESPDGKLGTAQVTVTLDVGGKTLTAIQMIEVVAGSATQLGLQPVGTTPRTDLGGTTTSPTGTGTTAPTDTGTTTPPDTSGTAGTAAGTPTPTP